MEFCMKPIGVIHTPFKDRSKTPIQFSRSTAFGEIEVYSEFEEGLTGIEELSHIMLIYVFHQVLDSKPLMVKPFLDENTHGVFATRYYARPNPIGFSIVRLIGRERTRLKIQWVDMLDGTPLLDIKPYIPEFDVHTVEKLGWYAARAHP